MIRIIIAALCTMAGIALDTTLFQKPILTGRTMLTQPQYVKDRSHTMNMSWREQVRLLEKEGSFDIAIYVLEKQIKKNPNEKDAYIMLLYRLMDSILENPCYWRNISKDPLREIKEEYYEDKNRYDYNKRVEKIFTTSYEKFSNDTEYLYYAALFLFHACIFTDLIDKESAFISMHKEAIARGYNAVIEQGYSGKESEIEWANRILNDPSIQDQLATKGAAAEYVLGNVVASAKKILQETPS